MKFILGLGEISQKARNAFFRFPVTLIWTIIGTIFTIWFIDADLPKDKDTPYIKVILIAILGVSWLISTRFLINYFIEVKHQPKQWLILIPLIFLGWYYWYLPNDNSAFDNEVYGYKTGLYFFAGHLFVFFSPFLFTWNKNAYWNFIKTVFIAIARSLLFSLILYLGLVLALLALKYLFKIDFNDEIYFKLFIFCLGIINTWIFLADFPQKIHDNLTINYTKALEVFVKYILIPLSVLYLIILYAYSLKILINWNLPKGWVSYLVIALSLLGFIIHILINPIKKTIASRTIKRFYPWFYILLLPMILLLFTAIYKRISQYGFTENRYFVLVIACWILGITLYILFSKQKQLRYFPMTLAFITLLASFGFWGAFSVSERSQVKQFSKIFTNIKAKDFKINRDEADQFRSVIRYLSERNAIEKTAPYIGFNPKKEFKDVSHWSMATKLVDTLNIEVVYNKNDIERNGYFSIDEVNTALDISGYDFFKQVNFYKSGLLYTGGSHNNINGYKMHLNLEESSFKIFKDSITSHKINLNPLIDKLLSKENRHDIHPSILTLEEEFDDMNIKLIFQNLYINNVKGSLPKINNANAYVLLKFKNDAQQN